eukprot:TRINITY_DN118_c0_g1_i4.p1 TRINITY_DN118_c0_g1~~TRINITY_DN118_c0_g1_i4.p1  ORF type:complete len:521 (+),score=48.74 TRINITY_DN118_c0_g1_i4:68-1564(+)
MRAAAADPRMCGQVATATPKRTLSACAVHRYQGYDYPALCEEEQAWFDEGTVRFYNQQDPYYQFTNFYRSSPFYDEHHRLWLTSEHYFQAKKFEPDCPNCRTAHSAQLVESIRMAPTPRDALNIARANKAWVHSSWYGGDGVQGRRVNAMIDAVRMKMQFDGAVRALLLSTGNARLVEHTDQDSFWGDGGVGFGTNMLGQILMLVRDEFRRGVLLPAMAARPERVQTEPRREQKQMRDAVSQCEPPPKLTATASLWVQPKPKLADTACQCQPQPELTATASQCETPTKLTTTATLYVQPKPKLADTACQYESREASQHLQFTASQHVWQREQKYAAPQDIGSAERVAGAQDIGSAERVAGAQGAPRHAASRRAPRHAASQEISSEDNVANALQRLRTSADYVKDLCQSLRSRDELGAGQSLRLQSLTLLRRLEHELEPPLICQGPDRDGAAGGARMRSTRTKNEMHLPRLRKVPRTECVPRGAAAAKGDRLKIRIATS